MLRIGGGHSCISPKTLLREEHVKIASIILCAGVGSRLKSSKSKLLHEVCGRPVAYWPIKHALMTTDVKPIVVVGHQSQQIVEKLRSYFGDEIDFAHQESPNGTGGAVQAALPHLDKKCESVLVLCGDTPMLSKESIARLITIQRNSHVPIAMMTSLAPEPFGYGRIVRNSSQQIVAIVEEKDASGVEREIREVNPGVYVFETSFLQEAIGLIKISREKREIYLTDLVKNYVSTGAHHGPVSSIEISYEEMHGVNDRKQLAQAQKMLNRKLIDQWMINGATFIDPDQAYVEEGVSLDADVVIYPGVHLRGSTSIKEGAVIENGCVVIDTVVEKDARLLPYSVCEGARIGERAHVGPFARLRKDAHLDADTKVGNFVEVKNSHLQKNTKANHLAYIGDATIGERCNIGAGTITCNYDGVRKHKTIIGDGSFIGSNSTLIAPLSIGEGAYVAGGSTVNSDVPAGKLALGRARQVNKDRKTKKRSEAIEA